MKKWRIIILWFLLLQATTLIAQDPLSDQGWHLIIDDNFNIFNNSIWKKWDDKVHGSGSDEEPQVYLNGNTYISNGNLVMELKREATDCPLSSGCYYNGEHMFSSGAVQSTTTFGYGYYEIYAKMDAAYKSWPAFWFWKSYSDNNTNNCWYNEIDVFEAYGNKPSYVESNVWYGFVCPITRFQLGITKHPCNYSASYHWYSIEWDYNKINWYVDHVLMRSIRNDVGNVGIHHSLFIIMNFALQPTNPSDLTNITYPHYMYVEEFRAFKLLYDCNTIVNEIPDFTSFDHKVKKSITLSSQTVLPSGSSESLRATDFVELKDGFEVPLGVSLYIDITPCVETLSNESQTENSY